MAVSSRRVALDARVSSAEHKSQLDSQAERRGADCGARGYQVAQVGTEGGLASWHPGSNDARPKVLARLPDQRSGLIVVAHQERLTRFGFCSLHTLLQSQGRALEGVKQAANGTEDVLAARTAIVSSCCARR